MNGRIEDVVQQTSENSEKLTKHEQDINSITDTVQAVETNLNENYSTTEQVESKIEQKAGVITQEVNKTIENIQVGGTNLIRNSAPYNRDYWIAYNVTSATVEEDSQAKRNCMKTILKSGQSGLYNNSATYANLEKNKEYSFSIWLKVSRNQQIRVGYEGSTHGFFDVTTEWKKYTLKFTCIDSARNFIIYATNALAGDILYFHSLKLEEGNKITAWSPSPDDEVKSAELGTKIEQNWEHVKIAWNQISEFIQFEVLNGNASIAFRNDAKNLLMVMDKLGQHFFDNNKSIMDVAVVTITPEESITKRALMFLLDTVNMGDNGVLGWGYKATENGKEIIIPAMYLGEINSGEGYGVHLAPTVDFFIHGTNSIRFQNCNIYENEIALVLEMHKNFTMIDKDLGNTILNVYQNEGGESTIDLGNNSIDNVRSLKTTNAFISRLMGIDNGNIEVPAEMRIREARIYGENAGEGFIMHGTNTGHRYSCNWMNNRLHFIVDTTDIGDVSDRRLKKEIKQVDEVLLKAINEVEYKQFKKDNRGGLISVGIIAQDLIEVFEKYNRKPEDYELFDQIQYRMNEDTLYYVIDYTQFLLLKTISKEREIEQLKQKDKEKDKIIANLITRIEKLEKAGESK